MQKFGLLLLALFTTGTLFTACSTDEAEIITPDDIPSEVLDKIEQAGFSLDGVMKFEDGYLIENDIYLTESQLHQMTRGTAIPTIEQYRTYNLVNGPRVITLYAEEGGRRGYSPGMIAGLDEAIRRYNALNLSLTFQRITTNNADITMTRLSKGDERRGILGSAGFPTASGDPYHEIKMSGILESYYGLSTDGIATIIAHEMGHCIGFRHTDYFNRAISCGGAYSNEGSGSVGAVHVPGTPTGADPRTDLSWMLACTDGGNRPFTNNDKTALNYLY